MRPESWEEMRWRLQHLAEERLGRVVRQQARMDDAGFDAAMRAAEEATRG